MSLRIPLFVVLRKSRIKQTRKSKIRSGRREKRILSKLKRLRRQWRLVKRQERQSFVLA